jgi:hypothetical protein
MKTIIENNCGGVSNHLGGTYYEFEIGGGYVLFVERVFAVPLPLLRRAPAAHPRGGEEEARENGEEREIPPPLPLPAHTDLL